MIVRPATAADHPGWSAMRRRLWPDCEPAELEREPPLIGLVAEADGRLVGFAEASVRDYAEGAPAGPAAYLEGIWVEPAWRRRGVARALIAYTEAEARRRGRDRLRIQVRIPLIDNQLLFKSCGFVEVSRETHPGYTAPTTIRMEKRLQYHAVLLDPARDFW